MFPKPGLYNNEGSLRERWGQGANDLIAVSDNTLIDESMYTVTAGKRLFVKTVVVKDAAASATCYARFKDAVGGADLLTVSIIGSGVEKALTLDVPIAFDTEVYIGTGTAVDVSIVGWEEDL